MDLPDDLKLMFVDWLEEEIKTLSLRQHKIGMTYTKALENLKAHEGKLATPSDLKKVRFVGPKLIDNMSKRLHMYCLENGYTYPTETINTLEENTTNKRKNTNTNNEPKKKSTKTYIPRKNSGAYAILLVLLEFDPEDRGMIRDSIAVNARPYCSTSFENNPSANQLHSAWNSIKTLINHELVRAQGRPMKYYLTEEGKALAENLKQTDNIKFRNEVASPERLKQNSITGQRNVVLQSSNEIFEYEGDSYLFWDSGSFDIIFIIDNREIRAQNQRDFFLNKLLQIGIKCEQRALSVGDGLWIARNKVTNEEVVLNYIIERKRLDDLASSIKDGRYTEQKVRLKRTGVENIFYLIEEVTSSELQKMAEAIQTSISMAMTNSNFHCIRTKDPDETILFIEKITNELNKFYKDKKLLVLYPDNLQQQKDYADMLEKFRKKFKENEIECVHTYPTFDTMLSKSDLMTTKELLVRMLMTIRGISLEKAIAIQREFKTPKLLVKNFDKHDKELTSKYGKKIQEQIAEIFQNE